MNLSRASFPSLAPMERHNLPNSEFEDDFGAAAVVGPPPHPRVKMRAAGTRNLRHFMASSSLTCYHTEKNLWIRKGTKGALRNLESYIFIYNLYHFFLIFSIYLFRIN
jgi:hypothetical protein